MAEAKAIVDIEINTGAAAAQLKALQQQINAFNVAINKGNTFQTQAIANFTTELKDVINASRFFTAESVKMQTAAGSLDSTLRKGRGTLSQYFSARFNKNSALFAETLGLASERARTLQTQFIATSSASKGMQEALAIKPLTAFNSELTIAAQKTQILTQMFRQGTTQLVNLGKNIQWAGRQLMVGFTLPLTVFGSVAGKTFMELEREVVNFRKVYGDLFTTPRELEENIQAVQELAGEYTKYGIAVKDTIGLAAEAAAAGRTNQELTDAVAQATRLSTLGQMNQNQALETTIALQSAFRLSGEELANTINFLNMVENQTVVTLQDLAAAIPRVAPVIKGLGGDVQDMAVFLAAMQEGGVSAEQGANALKSGLASLINPTNRAIEKLAEFNVNLEAIVQQNQGDLMGTVTSFARALQSLDQFQRQQALEQVFGKFQYARLGALFENIVRDGSQANQVLETTAFTAEQLRQTAEKELGAIEQSLGVQLTGAMERFKLAIAPIGELFVQLAIPVVNFATKIVEAFNSLPDFQKKFIAFATVIGGLIIPAGTMLVGLLLNLGGQILKISQYFGVFAKGMISKGGVVGGIQAVSQSMKYMSLQEMEAALAAEQLSFATKDANTAFLAQVGAAESAEAAVRDLGNTYQYLINRMTEASRLSSVTLGTPGAALNIAAARNPKKMARGGLVPGSGNTDTVPAMLMPGEFVVTKDATRTVGKDFLSRLNKGGIAGYQNGTLPEGLERFRAMQQENALGATSRTRTALGITPTAYEQSMYNPRLVAGSEELLSNAVYMFEDRYNQGLNASKKFQGGYGVPYGSVKSLLKGKGLVDNPFIYLDEYSRSMDIPFDKQQHSNALIDAIDDLARGARPGQKIRIVDNDIALQRAIANDPSAHYIKMSDVYKTPKVQASLGGLRNVVAAQSTVRGTELIKKKQSFKSGMTKPISLRMQKSMGKTPITSYMGIRQRKNVQNYIASVISKARSRGRTGFGSVNLQGTHFFNKGGSVPSLLTPGEYVVNRESAQQYRPFLDALNAGQVKGFQNGGPTLGQRVGAAASRAGRFAGAAALPALIAGPLLSSSSNETAQQLGNFANQIAMAGFAAQGLQGALKGAQKIGLLARIVPLLTNPITPVIAGVTALGVGVALAAKKINDVENAGAKLIEAMTGSAGQIQRFADAMGTETLRQQRIRTVASRAAGVTEEGQTAAAGFMDSDAGKQLLADLERVKDAGESVQQALANQLNRAILEGVMTPDEAKAIAVEVGTALENQTLGVNVSGSIVELYDKDGKLIQENLIKLNAAITPTLDTDRMRQVAEETYDQNASWWMKARDALTQGESREVAIQNSMIEQTSESVAGSLSATAASVENLKYAYANGAIELEDYREQVALLRDESRDTVSKGLDVLGVSFEDLQDKLGDKSVFDFKNFWGTLEKDEAEALEIIQGTANNARDILSDTIGKKPAEDLMSYIKEEMTGGDAQAASDVFSQIVTGDMESETLNAMLRGIKNPELREMIRSLFNITLTIDAEAMFGNFYDGTKKTFEITAEFTEEYTGTTDDNTKAQKTNIQTLQERIALTKQQLSATRELMQRGITPEGLATLDAATAIEIMTNKRYDLIKAINDQATRQRLLAKISMSADEKRIAILESQNRYISAQIKEVQKQISVVDRLNELDQRQIELRQRGLDQLGKKEDSINKQYDSRIDALNRVAQANDRVAQSEQDRIDLASALSSGDIAAAAGAANQMTQNFAQSQIEDTRAQLELQRERELEALAVNINGQLLTRSQIEAQIDEINERIYQRNLSTIALQDQIFALEEQRRLKDEEIEGINNKILLNQIEQEKKLASKNKKLKDSVEYLKAEYRLQQAIARGDFGRSADVVASPPKNAFGGKIKAMAFGGFAKYTSNESPPGMMMGGKVKNYAFGSVVPGLGNTDRVPALLTPGEFVVRKSVAQQNMGLLKALNGDVFPQVSGTGFDTGTTFAPVMTSNITNMPVYNNYSVNVNVPNVNASPEEIANVVASKLRRVSAGDIRGTRRI